MVVAGSGRRDRYFRSYVQLSSHPIAEVTILVHLTFPSTTVSPFNNHLELP